MSTPAETQLPDPNAQPVGAVEPNSDTTFEQNAQAQEQAWLHYYSDQATQTSQAKRTQSSFGNLTINQLASNLAQAVMGLINDLITATSLDDVLRAITSRFLYLGITLVIGACLYLMLEQIKQVAFTEV